MKSGKVIIIKGSRSDREFCKKLGDFLEDNEIEVIYRTASAHRTPSYLQKIIGEYSDTDIIAFITVAGLSDALSGATSANTEKLVIAYPPDLIKYGKAKIFSSTKLPRGLKVFLARSLKEVLQILNQKSLKKIYDEKEINERKIKVLETFFTDNEDLCIKTPLGLPLYLKGKVRDVYELEDKLLINSSDRISAFDVNSITEIEGKGMSLNLLSMWWFKQTNKIFPNHFMDIPDITMMLVKKARRVDIEWVIRGYLYGSLYREYEKGKREFFGHKLPNGLQLAEKLPEVLLTPTTKADAGHDMPITKEESIDTGLVTKEEWKIFEEATFKLYEYYTDVANQKGFIIPDFKLEFGRSNGSLIQIDESPNHDSARIWIKKYYQIGKRQEAWCADKEFYRQFLLDTGIDPKNPPNPLPKIPRQCIEEIQKRLGAYEVFTGTKSIDSLQLKNLEDVEKELGIKC
jgi:phosphoribosylaminoimidazole-succinocarboxamide synthase